MPDGAQDFAYTTTGTGAHRASRLDDDGVNDGLNGDILNTKVFNNLAPGAYTVDRDAAGHRLRPDQPGLQLDLGTGASDADNIGHRRLDHHTSVPARRSPAPTRTPSAARSRSSRTPIPTGPRTSPTRPTGTGAHRASPLDDDGVNDGLNGDILNTKVFSNLAPGNYSVDRDAAGHRLRPDEPGLQLDRHRHQRLGEHRPPASSTITLGAGGR